MSPSADAAVPVSTPAPPLAPLIAAQLKFLLSNSNLPIKVVKIWSGCRNGDYTDRFTLAIPFCLDYVHWDFLYNALFPKVAPDVVFGPKDENFQPLVDYADTGNGDKSCLARWDCRDRGALLALVMELLLLYSEYQKKRVADLDDARLNFEISTVLTSEAMEVSMLLSTDRSDDVKFAIPLLDSDLQKLVTGCPWKLPQKIHLQAIFPVSRGYSSVSSAPRLKLISIPDLKSFFSVDGVKLPSWVDGMCLAEYVPALKEDLKEKVVEASASIGSRRRFIEALAPAFGRPLESDPIFCRKATVLCISGIFTFLVQFAIPLEFPKEKPVLTIQSSQPFNSHGTPIMSSPIDKFPWSPRWDSTEMVERIYDFLVDECQSFKKYCDSVPLPK